jgi:exosome complex exonuclease DIS3/RRP44
MIKLMVGIVRRRWRPYCGIILDGADEAKSKHHLLFRSKEKTLPLVRIKSQTPEALNGQQVVVCIDGWPQNSKYPVVSTGHIMPIVYIL